MDFGNGFDVAGDDDVPVLLFSCDFKLVEEIDVAFCINDLPAWRRGAGDFEIIAPLEMVFVVHFVDGC